ncbi:MAG TPA: hypothetical protein DCS67_03715 [Clostridiales bacterium UBA8960]|jgi:alpha-D-ribose 1-methylphosphonate 5-triphosphate synthase subunit PhnI|nr:hypothetical protein [Clostridiales bacterium UBA8960]
MVKDNYNRSNFLISIHHQENHSWQGVIEWLDTGKKVHFRSELELLNLINMAVQGEQEHSKKFRDWDETQKLVSVR